MNPRSAALALGFSSAGHFFAHLLMLLYPTIVLVLEGRWGLSYGDLLSLSLGGFVLFGLGALPAGWLGDRWSAERMMVVFFVGTGGAAIATGFAPSDSSVRSTIRSAPPGSSATPKIADGPSAGTGSRGAWASRRGHSSP